MHLRKRFNFCLTVHGWHDPYSMFKVSFLSFILNKFVKYLGADKNVKYPRLILNFLISGLE